MYDDDEATEVDPEPAQRVRRLQALAGQLEAKGLPSGQEFNPFLEEGGARSEDGETAGLASLLTGEDRPSDDEDLVNPFLTAEGGPKEATAEELAALLAGEAEPAAAEAPVATGKKKR